MAKERKQYELVDYLLAFLVEKLRKEVNRLDVMAFDELNTPRITTLTKQMVNRLLKDNKKAYLRIAKAASEEAADDVKDLGLVGVAFIPDEKYVDGILGEYNPVTGYLYYPEADRKRARIAEAMITALLIASRKDYHKELKRFADLWKTQTSQYGDTMVDRARVDTFKKNGIKRVRWVSQKDEKVCEECRDRDGKIYPIDKIPDKPHYHCRCWIMPIKDSNG